MNLEKKYLIINSEAKFEVLVNDDVNIDQISKFKYFVVQLDKNQLEERIKTKDSNCLNYFCCDKLITNKHKMRVGKAHVDLSCVTDQKCRP